MSGNPGPSFVRTDDSNFEEKLSRIIDEVGSDISDFDFSYVKDGDIIHSEHDSESSVSGESESDEERYEGESDSDEEEERAGKYFYGRNRSKWSAVQPNRHVRIPTHNILKIPALRHKFRGQSQIDPLTAWSYIFSDDMLNEILTGTNEKLEKIHGKYTNTEKIEVRPCTMTEMKSYIGLLIYTAVFKSNNEDIRSLFCTDGTGRDIFSINMSSARFSVILNCLRFDNPDDRELRKVSDPAAGTTNILHKFNENSQRSYILGAHATVDEMIIGFRGRCKFKTYIPSEPAKCGQKLQCFANSRTNYIFNTYLCCEKGPDGAGLSPDEKEYAVPTQAVLRLCKPIAHTNQIITADNWCVSIELAGVLRKNGLNTVGTMRKNRKEIPASFCLTVDVKLEQRCMDLPNTSR
ncbi:piggyBac transposable element-derived protein 4-like [Schistocerca serialis cubense]|uniref:piggyBac transposable element-derived protein 4-like n=1 Tax=Schistocerca serialis cubense TaxID=2023355 RepID=UPI00214ED44C|nr:piggyBac transposable element-derived protein 4-like [Schistocerca serialis cubense]